MSGVLRMGGPAMKQLATIALHGTPAQLHAAADTDTRFHSTPLHDAYLADSKAVHDKADELNDRHLAWEAVLAGLTPPGSGSGFQSVADFRWAPGSGGDPRGDFFDQTGLGPWLGKRMFTTEADIAKVVTPTPSAETVKAAKALGDAQYGGPRPDVNDPDYLRKVNEHGLWQQDQAGFLLSSDDIRLFLQYGGFPRSVAQDGTAEFRVAVEDLKTRYASCDSGNPDKVDANKVLGPQVQAATTEWQSEIAGQQEQRDTVLVANHDATEALQKSSQALGEALAQSWLADHLSRWQGYWLPGGKGTQGQGPVVFQLHSSPDQCLDVPRADPTDGNDVQLYACNGTGAQKWTPGWDGSLVNVATNKCLDAVGNNGPLQNRTKMEIWTCNGGANQKWQLATSGKTGLQLANTNLCVDINTPRGSSMLWECNGTWAQQFDAQQDNSGTGTGTDNPSYPKQAQFDAAQAALGNAQQAAKSLLDVVRQQAPIARRAAMDTSAALQQAYGIADAAGQPRGRGLLAAQQEAQATLASAAALDAEVKAAETAYNATMASGADSQTLQQLAQTQLHAAQAAFRTTAAQAAADQAKAAADGAELQAKRAAQAGKDAQAALTKVQAAEQSAKQAADTAKTKRAAAEASKATAADAKDKAAAAQTKTATDRATAQTKADAAKTAADAAKAAGTTAAQKRSAAQAADTAAQEARRKAWDAEQAHNAVQAKVEAANADAAAKASGPYAQAAKEAATAAAADATTAQTNADQASKAATQAEADAKTANAEATRAEGAAAQAQSEANDADAAKAKADQAVRTDQVAVAEARAASGDAAAAATTAQDDAATAQAQADSAKSNASQAWAQASQAHATAASAAGFAYATAQAAGAASASAQQVVTPANDAIQLGAPYQESDASAGLAVLTGQATKTIAEQQQAVAKAKADQAKQAADQADSLANSATGDAQVADQAAARAAGSAATAKGSARDALASSATAAQALADALASQTKTVGYDAQATADAAAATAAAKGAASDASDARTSAVTAADDADKAKVEASDAQSAATAARSAAAQAAKDAEAAAAAAKDAQSQAAAARQSALNAEKLAAADQEAKARADAQKAAADQQASLQTGGATKTPNVFTQQTVTPIGDPTPDNECKLSGALSFCDVTFTLRFNVRIDFYSHLPRAQTSDIPGPAAYYDIVWLGSTTTEVDRKATQRFTEIGIFLKLAKAVIEATAQSIAKDADDCSRSGGTSPSCMVGLTFLPGGKAVKGAEMALQTDKAITTGVDIDKALAAVKAADIESATAAQLIRELESAQQILVGCANSFPTGTAVLMGDGTRRPIEQIRVGDVVTATNPATGVTSAQRVENTIRTPDDRDFTELTITAPDGTTSTITSTDHHPYWSENAHNWRDAVSLTAGDTLRTPDGQTVGIAAVRHWKTLQPAYNLTVNNVHTYYVLAGNMPVLVHNTCGKIAYNSNELSNMAYRARLAAGISPGRNVAVARVPGWNDPKTGDLVVGFSKGDGYHSENHILDQLAAKGYKPNQITELYSERQPCPVCGPLLDGALTPGTPISWSVPWGSDSMLNSAYNEMLRQMIAAAGGR